MAIKRVPPIGLIRLKNPDGSTMKGDNDEPSFARAHSPASKLWQTLDTARHRKGLARVRENGGRVEALADSRQDDKEFLAGIVEEFINLPSGTTTEDAHGKKLVEIVLDDPEIGYIFDQLNGDTKDWGAFLPLPPTSSNGGSVNTSG